MLTLDSWQEELLAHEGNVCAACGRQVGKSTIISIKAGKFAVDNPKNTIMVISAVERQAELLFEKILDYLYENHKKTLVLDGSEKPTKHKCSLKNGSVIHCLPTGTDGRGIRGFTINLLICDEAAFVPEAVFVAVTPSLITTNAKIWLLGTPHGRQGYFYRSFTDPDFRSFHISSWDCPRANKDYLEREQKSMSKLNWLQEYGGNFVEGLFQYFPMEIIKNTLCLDKTDSIVIGDTFLGVDVAGQGEDDTVLFSVCRIEREKIRQLDMEIMKHSLLHQTFLKIKLADSKYKFKQIYVDSGGLGVAISQSLLQDSQTRCKTIEINNASRSISKKEEQKKKLLKEDLYANLLYLMESGKIKLFNDPEIMLSLSSVQYEITDNGETKIFGNFTHITESLIRAAWCMQDKHLNLWIA